MPIQGNIGQVRLGAGTKVFVVRNNPSEIVAEGLCDGKAIDQYYVRVNGQIYLRASVIPDTPENRSRFAEIAQRCAELRRLLMEAEYSVTTLGHI